ncbi:lysophospholipid acyltransferase family protein [Nocardioides stalactiti]|uniref:lysophospholipid acyltransferase family protein n=1 Tax=Nocardioides stalactiti TaxID=2755356 RepID=UPI0016010F6F|nr:lysophospholipid acyltransferase family protein [Nocardioides stalactiti]
MNDDAAPALSDGARLGLELTAVDKAAFAALTAPLRLWSSPVFEGMDHLPETGSALLVGNHTMYGMLDALVLAEHVQRRHGRVIRVLAEDVHYTVPGHRDVLTRWGAVRASRENCRTMLGHDELVMVFPGGAREVTKRKGEKYQLMWKGRTGFARMAVEAGCPIIPVSSIGVEDSFDIVLDADSLALRPLRRFLESRGFRWSELALPIARGVGPTPIPRPERYYFRLGAPIDTRRFGGLADEAAVTSVRDEVHGAVLDGLHALFDQQSADPGRHLSGRVRVALLG